MLRYTYTAYLVRVLCPLSDIPRTNFLCHVLPVLQYRRAQLVLSDNQSCRQPLDNVPYFKYICTLTVVGIATGPWAGRSKFRTPAGREIFSPPKLSAQPASNSTCIGLLFRGWSDRWSEADHTPPFSADVRNKGSYTSIQVDTPAVWGIYT
jgi:hypothetical protein